METEGHVGAVDIVVDGLGQADDVEALLSQKIGRLMGAVAAQTEKAVQLHGGVVLLHLGHLVHIVLAHDPHELEGRALGAQDGAAYGKDTGKFIGLHLPPLAVDETGEAVGNADDGHVLPKALIQGLGHTADGRVESRAVTAGGQDTHSLFHKSSPFITIWYKSTFSRMDCQYPPVRADTCRLHHFLHFSLPR